MKALRGLMLIAMLAALAPPPIECHASDMCPEGQGCCGDPSSCPLMFTCAPTDQSAEQPVRIDVRPVATAVAFLVTASCAATAVRAHAAPPRALPGSVPRWLLHRSLII